MEIATLDEHARGRPAFEILLPDGTRPGDEIDASTPIGLVTLVVPDEAGPGDYLAFFLDAMFEVTLPEGVVPGQVIEASTPNGTVTVVVPEGAGPGDILAFSFEAAEAPAAPADAMKAEASSGRGSFSRLGSSMRNLRLRAGGLLRKKGASSSVESYEAVPLPDSDEVLASWPSGTVAAVVAAAAPSGLPDPVEAGAVRPRANSRSAEEAMACAARVKVEREATRARLVVAFRPHWHRRTCGVRLFFMRPRTYTYSHAHAGTSVAGPSHCSPRRQKSRRRALQLLWRQWRSLPLRWARRSTSSHRGV